MATAVVAVGLVAAVHVMPGPDPDAMDVELPRPEAAGDGDEEGTGAEPDGDDATGGDPGDVGDLTRGDPGDVVELEGGATEPEGGDPDEASDPTGPRDPQARGPGPECHRPNCLLWSVGPEPPVVPSAEPSVGGGTLLVRRADALGAIDLGSGRVRWTREPEPPGDELRSSDLAYHATDDLAVLLTDGRLEALELADGELRWDTDAWELARVGEALQIEDTLLVTSSRRTGPPRRTVEVLALDLETGERRWSRRANDAALTPSGAVVLDDGGVLTGLDVHDGRERWGRDLQGPLDQLAAVDEVVVARRAASGRDGTSVLAATDGSTLVEGASGLAVPLRFSAGGALVVPTGDEVALVEDGELRWTAGTEGSCCTGSFVDEAIVTVRRSDGSLLEFARDDGALLEQRDDPAAGSAPQETALIGRFVFAVDGFDPATWPVVSATDVVTGRHVATLRDAFPAHLLPGGDVIVLGSGRVSRLSADGGEPRLPPAGRSANQRAAER